MLIDLNEEELMLLIAGLHLKEQETTAYVEECGGLIARLEEAGRCIILQKNIESMTHRLKREE